MSSSLPSNTRVPYACHFVMEGEKIWFASEQIDAIAVRNRRSALALRALMSRRASLGAACRYRALQAQAWAAGLLRDEWFVPRPGAFPWTAYDPFAWLAEPMEAR